MMIKLVLVLFFVIGAFAQNSFESSGVQLALKIYDDCSKTEGLSVCLKKKAITFIDRLGRMDKLSLSDGIIVHKTADAPKDAAAITEEELDKTLQRSLDAKDDALTGIMFDKISNFIGSRSIEVALPKIDASELIEEGRKGDFDFGGGGGKKGGKKHNKGGKKGMMGNLMMIIAAKLAALLPLKIAALFIMAKKALIIAKIALLISGLIAAKKLLGAKKGGGSSGGWQSVSDGGWQSGGGGGWQSGGGGGWQAGGGGGWDKRSTNEAQPLAYNAYKPKQI